MSSARLVLFLLLLTTAAEGSERSRWFFNPYEACLDKLKGKLASTDLIDNVIRNLDVQGVGVPAGKWNINGPYDFNSVNLLVPASNAAPWPAECTLPADFARCQSFPAYRVIICNPPFGKEVSNVEIFPGAFRPEVVIAGRFMALTVLGHELGHLEEEWSLASRGFSPALLKGDLTCYDRRGFGGPPVLTAEELADRRGLVLACEALRQDESLGYLRGVLGEQLNLGTQARDFLNMRYFLADDTCVPTREYQALARRKHAFMGELLDCLYPGENDPGKWLSREDREAFEQLEQELVRRQARGYAASLPYGVSIPLRQQVVPGAAGRLLSFERTSGSAALSIVIAARDRPLSPERDYKTLVTWQESVRLVSAVAEGSGWSVLMHLRGDGSSRLQRLRITCAGEDDARLCMLSQEGPPVPVRTGDETFFVAAPGGVLLQLLPGEMTVFRDLGQLASNTPAGRTPRLCSKGSPDLSLASASSAAFAVAFGLCAHGLCFAEVIEDGTPKCVDVEFPLEHGSLEAFTLTEERALFLLKGEQGEVLWSCPRVLLSGRSRQGERCRVYRPPERIAAGWTTPTGDLGIMDVHVRAGLPGCGGMVAISGMGRTWVLEGDASPTRTDSLPANGIAGCEADGKILSYRAGRIDLLHPPEWTPLEASEQLLRATVRAPSSSRRRPR